MKLKTEHGFTVIGLLVLLPVLFSMVVVCAASMSLLTTDAELKHECRTTLLEGQDQIAKDLETLMKLNDSARTLREARAAAEAAMKIAIVPPAVAAARAALAVIKARQAVLAAQQTALIFRAKARSRTTPLKTKLKLHQSLRAKARLAEKSSGNVDSKFHSASFELIASPADSITPDYRPVSDFSSRQEMTVVAKWSVTSLLPEWLRNWLGKDDLQMTTSCTATIVKGKTGWRSLLKADKS